MTDAPHIPLTSHHFIEADGVNVFYREAGPANALGHSSPPRVPPHLPSSIANSSRASPIVTM